ncbi:MAG: tetratricopeptide repeat protein [Halobacteriovoraceae bacterium]|jgi:tetratricopeptide (TPR) repeat protein|nr:tetratricopeptide repeat protein [Halobacteriovoraceae bacterium]
MSENFENMHSTIQNDPSVDPAIGFLPEVHDEETYSEDLIPQREMGKAYYQLGKVYYDKSDLNKAETYFKAALERADKPRDIFTIFKILGFLIRVSSEKLEDAQASLYIQEAENLAEEMTSVLGSLSAEYFYNVGIVKNYGGKFEEAKQNFLLAYKKSKEENEPEVLAKCLLALAINCYNQREFENALEYLGQLGQLLKIIKKAYLNGAMYLFAAKVYTELDMYENALRNFSLANETLHQKKCWNLFGYVLLGKGIVHKRIGDFGRALDYFQLAKESSDSLSFKRLNELVSNEIQDVNDSSVDLYLDKTNRKVKERSLGTIDFKHRFVLLEILFLLAKNPGQFFDKEHLAKSIWKDEYNPLIHDKLIYTSVSRLRKLIEPKNTKGEKRKYIIRGKDGYTFNPLVKIRFHLENNVTTGKTIGNVEISSPV